MACPNSSDTLTDTTLEPTFSRLGDLLDRLGWLWRPAPFHQAWPDWCRRLPELPPRLLALTDDEVERLAADDTALRGLLAGSIPESAELESLSAVPVVEGVFPPGTSRLAWGVPGRKQDQIEAFAAAVGQPRAPVLEWCAGKGHLGRLLASRWNVPVASLEIDAQLCADGGHLASRAGVDQSFLCADALAPGTAGHLQGRHGVALHACGDLHLALLRGAVEQGAKALDLAPCCYYRTAQPVYQPMNSGMGPVLSRDELHLPVTETATAGRGERRRRDRGMAWKLGFLALRDDLAPELAGRTFKAVPGSWLALDFPDFCLRLAAREGVVPPPGLDLAAYAAQGWRRQREVARLGLVRLAFRRALEVWLVLDRALYLRRAGYQVRVAQFCPRSTTPRNLLISARH